MSLLRNLPCGRVGVLFPLLTTAIAIWFSCAASAQVVVTGPSATQSHSLQTWYDLHIPARFQAHSRLMVDVLTDAQMDNYIAREQGDASHSTSDDAGDIDGVFESDPDRITLRDSPADGPDKFTFAHEYGHYVWFHMLTKDDRNRYQKIYDRQRAADQLVTHYASTDVQEGFAEAFSFYICSPVLLNHRDPVSFQFIDRWIDRA